MVTQRVAKVGCRSPDPLFPIGVGAIFTDKGRPKASAATFVGDPRVYGRIYMGMNGRGIIYGDTANLM